MSGIGPGPEAFIVGALRTPIGKRGGALSSLHPVTLLAQLLRGIVEQSGIDPAQVDDVIGGCVTQCGAQGSNVTRNAWLAAGLPWDVPATTVDRQCGSAQQAIHFAAQGIMSQQYDLVVACGVESMSQVPLGANVRGPGEFPHGVWAEACGVEAISQFRAAQEIARRWDISREEMDFRALDSHRKAARAIDEGRFDREILPLKVTVADGATTLVDRDEGVRRDTSVEKLAALSPVEPESPDITAGNSSQMSDGAAAVLLASEEQARRLALTPRARITAMSVAACEPVVMLQGPVPATRKLLQRTGMSIDDFDVLECNEAMGSIVPMWQKEFGIDWERINPNGSGISIGHPVGATGARMTVTLLHELERIGGRYGFQTMCEGGGQANAMVIERLG